MKHEPKVEIPGAEKFYDQLNQFGLFDESYPVSKINTTTVPFLYWPIFIY